MATLSRHGGSCCGMRHIYGFGDVRTSAAELLRHTGTVGDETLNLEVILSDYQTQTMPELLAELARLGYVYTTSWNGQHGTPVHLFHRAKQRLALQSARFYGQWVNDCNGMVAGPALMGTLPQWNERGVQQNNGWVQGGRVRCIDRRSGRFGEVAKIIRTDTYYYAHLRYERDRRVVEVYNFARYEFVQPEEPQVPVAPTIYRHENAQENVVLPARRLILSQFYCVFRDTGLPSRVFNTLEMGQLVFPRALDWHERKIYSDGDIVEGPVNHG